MSATIIYASGYPSVSKPLETKCNVAQNGLVTATALFLPKPDEAGLPIGSPISHLLWPALRKENIQARLFVSARSVEKVGGIEYLRISATGAVYPQMFATSKSLQTRSFTAHRPAFTNTLWNGMQIEVPATGVSFLSTIEIYTTSTTYVSGSGSLPEPPRPRILSVFARKQTGAGAFVYTVPFRSVYNLNIISNAAITQPIFYVAPQAIFTGQRTEENGIVQESMTADCVWTT